MSGFVDAMGAKVAVRKRAGKFGYLSERGDVTLTSALLEITAIFFRKATFAYEKSCCQKFCNLITSNRIILSTYILVVSF